MGIGMVGRVDAGDVRPRIVALSEYVAGYGAEYERLGADQIRAPERSIVDVGGGRAVVDEQVAVVDAADKDAVAVCCPGNSPHAKHSSEDAGC